MKATVTFERELDKVPESCSRCPFADACDHMIGGITKRGGMEFTARAAKGRVKSCPLKVEG